jgi:hypothetical protein
MSKQKKRFLTNFSDNNPVLLRNEYANALIQAGLLQKIDLNDSITIREEKNATKHTIIINNLLCTNETATQSVMDIWVFNLETEKRGFTTIGKTTECAILVFLQGENQDKIVILLPELKQSLTTNKTLSDCETKFKDTMNRLYLLLLATNDRETMKNERTTIFQFKGFIFYQNDNLNANETSELYNIYKGDSTVYTCSTLLNENDKINIECIKTSEKQTFSLKTLIF